MEKPDANGFVNVTWPSKNIPYGGVFHTRIAKPSSAQQELLKILLVESKLSIAQRQKSAWGLRQENEEVEPQPQRASVPLIRPRTSRRRSLSAIRESGALDLDPYRPIKHGEDREKLKDKLANAMAYGDTPDQQLPQMCLEKPKPKLPTAKEMKNELLTQIRERAEWLAEMEDLGQAGPHREIIKDQIAERLRALDALGIESECSSARSFATGFSTLRSKEDILEQKSVKSNESAAKLKHSANASQDKQKRIRSSAKDHARKEENVITYSKLSPLQYSPRRRV